MKEIKYTCTCKNDENAIKVFHDTLKALSNYAGMANISIEGFCDHIYYNQKDNSLEKLTFRGGYTKDSYTTSEPLSHEEEDLFYSDLRRGGISVIVRYKEVYKSNTLKDFRVLNINPMPKEIN